MFKEFEGRIALITENDRTVFYHELAWMAKTAVSKLKKRKLAFLVTDNNVESIVFYIGMLDKRVVPMLLHRKQQKEMFDNLIKAYAPSYVVFPCDFFWRGEGYGQIDVFENYVVYERMQVDICYEIADELALLLSTSGSTGSAKCVRISYENLLENTRSICQSLEIQREDRAITTLPMSYTYGLSIINTHLYKGASIILNHYGVIYQKFWDLVEKYRCTTFGGVPYMYETLVRLKLLDKLQGLRYITQAGGKLDISVVKNICDYCSKINVKFIVMYGQTEATARISVLPWEMWEGNWDSIGMAIPGVELYLTDEQGEKITVFHKEGEIVCRGKNVSMGYAESYQDLKAGDVNEGILKTGDMAYLKENGLLVVTGRRKRIMKLYGNRISLDEVERFLQARGYQVICVETTGKLYVVFVNSDITDGVKEELIKFGILSGDVMLRRVREIPRNTSGKVDYSKLAKELG